ncbi:o-succinylbenzoate synthase [Erwinia oleae]|uniref:o-succinylbenzoate synthase n=1 Tax=Erwinia oleae TaxID=796334 RepID=UPI00055475ED|nr:o-succinylbenzoate synthase [Erwinia oleae]
MRDATLFHYEIPLEAGTVLRDSRIKSRCGLLVRLREAGREGWGEIAPLPGFSAESLPEAQAEAIRLSDAWCEGEMSAESSLSSVAFGLSLAQAELAAELPTAGDVVGARLCTGDPDALIAGLHLQRTPVAKMKVGLYEPVRDGMMVNLLLEALPHLTLRLDANRCWSLEKACRFARFITPALHARIAFIEEPCRTPDESRCFAQETGMPLAWDEHLREPDFTLRAEPHLRAVVIKPMLTGSLRQVRQLIENAQQKGLTAVIGSSLESSLGLTQLARIARWLTPETPPGLDTLDLMQQQLVRRWPGCTLPRVTADALESVWRR